MIPAKLIAEYFYEFKKVSFEGIGTLERKHTPAKLDVAAKVFIPPKMYIEFSKEVTNSKDFIRYLCITQNITEKQAQIKVEKFISELKAVLETQYEYQLDKLGKFKYNPDTKEISFEQNPDAFADNPLYFGLGEAHFISSTRSTLTPQNSSEKKQKPTEEAQKIGSQSITTTQPAKITAQELKMSLAEMEEKEKIQKEQQKKVEAPVLIPIVLTVGMGLLFVSIFMFGLSYFFPSLDALHIYHHTKIDSAKNQAVYLDTTKSTVHKDSTQKVSIENQTPTPPTSNLPTRSDIVNEAGNANGSYYIIAGSFTSFETANKQIEKWRNKGFEAHLLVSPQGRYRLYLSQTNNEQDAVNMLAELKSKTGKKDLWILYQ
ncbi:MAG: SPOR domain-containing protein [Bacteroidia bacterium]|nr:SPOR domain-containing protein [Bacteroidia bacterium]